MGILTHIVPYFCVKAEADITAIDTTIVIIIVNLIKRLPSQESTLLLVLLVDVVNLLELRDDFFHLLVSRGISFGLFDPIDKPLLL